MGQAPAPAPRHPAQVTLDALARRGCAVVGMARAPADAEGLLAGASQIVLVGAGGAAVWGPFQAWLTEEPARRALTDPLDTFIADALPAATPRARWWVADLACPFDLRAAAVEAGLGAPGRMGLVMHPEHGSWWAIRAVALVTEPLAAPPAAPPAAPCEACPGLCVTACPAGAFDGGAWDAVACVRWRRAQPTCDAGCLARLACPAGAPSRYGEDQRRWHDAVMRRILAGSGNDPP